MTSAEMPIALPRPEKREAGRTAAAGTPLHIRMRGVPSSDELLEHVREAASRRLGRFAFHLTRITVRFQDENGPKGGVDITCRVKLVVPGMRTIVVEARDVDTFAALGHAMDAAERTLVRSLERQDRHVPKGWRDDHRATDGSVAIHDGGAREPGRPMVTRGMKDNRWRLRPTLREESPRMRTMRERARARMNERRERT